MCCAKYVRWVCLFGTLVSLFTPSLAFAPSTACKVPTLHKTIARPKSVEVYPHSVQLYSSSNNEDESMSESNQGILGAIGCVASLTVLYSEFVLLNTGCGLPAGPYGLVGLVEGLSYLTVIGIAKLSLYTKNKTGSGLPAGPGGVLGAAEGLSLLAAVVGIVALLFQMINYSYIPNAIPMEGGMCK